jgi:hypothetical protein
MKNITILLIAFLAIAGSAFAQTDTSATTAAQGSYPSGTSFNGISISALQIASGAIVASGGSAEGQLTISLTGKTALGTQQIINIAVDVTAGQRAAGNVAVVSGTGTVDMGDGTPPIVGVPIIATITTDSLHLGTVGLTIGATNLPAATIGNGSMTITNLTQ